MARVRGTGSIYLRGKTFWIKYHRYGKPYRESAHTEERREAERFLRFRLAQMAQARFVEPHLERIRVEELVEPYLKDLKYSKQAKDIVNPKARWTNHLEPVFGKLRVVDVTGTRLKDYVSERQRQGASNATIVRELAVLRRMFRLGYEADPQLVQRVPPFPKLKESSPRNGFLKDGDYSKLAHACAEEGLWLRAMLAVFYNYGWRKSEVLNLRVEQVDRLARTIRLETGETKNDEARTVVMTKEVYDLLTACVQGKDPKDLVFTRSNRHPVGDFRRSWRRVCRKAGIKLMVHDLRRTGARNMRNNGTPENVIMKIGGWKTPSVFRRYAIVDNDDLKLATQKMDQRHQIQFGHNFGHNAVELGRENNGQATQ